MKKGDGVPESWAEETVANAVGRMSARTPYFRWEREDFMNTFGANGVDAEVVTISTAVECKEAKHLQTRVSHTMKLIDGKNGYAILQGFLEEVQSTFAVHDLSYCTFASFLSDAFGNVFEERDGALLLEPYTVARQRALLFAFKWIYTKRDKELAAGKARWNTILQSLVNGETQFVLDHEKELFTSYHTDAKETVGGDI